MFTGARKKNKKKKKKTKTKKNKKKKKKKKRELDWELVASYFTVKSTDIFAVYLQIAFI